MSEQLLGEKKKLLADIIEILNELEKDYINAKAEKDKLEQEVHKCKVHLERATKLITGLGGEKD